MLKRTIKKKNKNFNTSIFQYKAINIFLHNKNDYENRMADSFIATFILLLYTYLNVQYLYM